MTLSEMLEALNAIVDDFVETTDAVRWLNFGQNKMALEVGAKLPCLTNNMDSTFSFPEEYHEVPIMYAAAKFKQQDSSPGEASMFMAEFREGLGMFKERWEVPPQFREDPFTQQFVAVAGAEPKFTITKESYSPATGNLKVYVNGHLDLSANVKYDKTFKLSHLALEDGDLITAVWEEHEDLDSPPYPWWKF